jgi:hypothetical protein
MGGADALGVGSGAPVADVTIGVGAADAGESVGAIAVGAAGTDGAGVGVCPLGAGLRGGAFVGGGGGGTTVVVKFAHRYSRGVSPEAWMSAARCRPTYRKCHGSKS